MCEIIKFQNLEFKKSIYKYHLDYFNKYYNDKFKSNQGVEEIFDLIHRYCPGGIWLDVGCGTTTLFWALMTSNISEINCADIYPEALSILNDFIYHNYIPNCYHDIMELYSIDKNYFNECKQKIKKYFVFDALKEWPEEVLKSKFDLVTQFGVFGLCESKEQYLNCFFSVGKALKNGGICIGANWILSKEYSRNRGVNNCYISKELIVKACDIYYLSLIEYGEKIIDGDPNYEKVIYWAIKNE